MKNKYLSYIDSRRRDNSFKNSVRLSGISASNTCYECGFNQHLQSQTLNVESPPDGKTVTNTVVATPSPETNHQLAVIMKRLDKVERIFNFINETELEFIKNEVIGRRVRNYQKQSWSRGESTTTNGR